MHFARPEELGFSSQRLTRINTKMQSYVDDNKVAGISTLVARRGKVVHFDHVGMADIEAKKPICADTIFRIYSMTKPITAVAALMLFEEGHFRLSDPVADYLPMFKEMQVLDGSEPLGARLVPAATPITIRQLMTHTAGLSYGFEPTFAADLPYRENVWKPADADPNLTLAEWVTAIAELPLAYHPGTSYRYSIATDVLGYLVEVISGQPFGDYLREHIFAPLGMEDTFFAIPAAKLDRFAINYGPNEEGGLKAIDLPQESDFARPTQHPSGGGGLLSTTPDYFRFAQMLLNRGELDGVRLLGRKTVELMTTNHLPDGMYVNMDSTSGLYHGLGVGILSDLGKGQMPGTVGSYGWGGAANTNFWIDPKEDLIGILMLQFMPANTYPVTPDFRILAYQSLVN